MTSMNVELLKRHLADTTMMWLIPILDKMKADGVIDGDSVTAEQVADYTWKRAIRAFEERMKRKATNG